MKISIGAIAGSWSRSATMAFYDAVALSSVDIVYIGTTINSPMAGLQKRDCLAVARELAAGGKEVVLSVRAAGAVCDAEESHAWIADGTLPVEVNDMRTLHALAGKVPLVIGSAMPCKNGDDLARLVELGAMRWVTPAICRGEVVKALTSVGESACQIEQPVLAPRHYSRWQCRVEDCPHEGWPMQAMAGCDREASLPTGEPDWGRDLKMLDAAGAEILRVTPRDVVDVGVSQILGELVRGEVEAAEAYARYTASSGQTCTQVPLTRHPWRPRPADPAGATVK